MLGEMLRLRLTMLLVWLGLIAGSIYVFIFEPGRAGFFPICPFRAATGLQCPGCGSTRGLHRLLHGDVIGAFEFNPLFVIAIPFLLYVLFRYTNAAIRNQPLRGNQLQPKYIWTIFVVIMAFWIFRNTPFYPFVS